jgi:VWFA-related protein
MRFPVFLFILLFALSASAQSVSRDFDFKPGGSIQITNLYGRVYVRAEDAEKVRLTATSARTPTEREIKTTTGGRLVITVEPSDPKSRIDLSITVPLHSRIGIETDRGEVRVSGDLESAEVKTEVGTISTDVPVDNLNYDFIWTRSRPRYMSDVPLSDVKEKAGGRFSLSGKLASKDPAKTVAAHGAENDENTDSSNTSDETEAGNEKSKVKDQKSKVKSKSPAPLKLNFTTARGIILLNVSPGEVPSNLEERPLTEAAKSIIRSGDSLLMEAIRRASPKYFGDYAKTLPPRKSLPSFSDGQSGTTDAGPVVKQVVARVTDVNNRAVENLEKKDFTLLENGKPREIESVERINAPYNLILLLDVSGSIENYVDFIRKAARSFIGTMNPKDRIAVVTFHDDVKVVSSFTTDRQKLSESLDSFDAGGGTAYYDAIAYSLVDTLRPIKGERTAIVILSDGDDNRSFLPFESLIGSIEESGALIYPLYVPSGLVAASATSDPNSTVDPLRTRYMALTSKADTEGARLAQISGGVYYPIRRLTDLQSAYNDIASQLRTAYTLTFRSEGGRSTRLKVKVNRENTFVNIGAAALGGR